MGLEGQIFNRFKIMKQLGEGPSAKVYLGENITTKQLAAIKVFKHVRMNERDAQRFSKEAQLLASLQHPNVALILDFGVNEYTPFLTTEYIAHDLQNIYQRGTKLSLSTLLTYIKQIASALQYMHKKNILHRDIRPSNIRIGENGEVRLGDINIPMSTEDHLVSSDENSPTTVHYMAPEQFKGKAGFASDQYALAIVVYEWLCGTAPFTEGDFMQLGFQHGYEPIPPMCEKNPSLSPDVERVVMSALAKDPKQRFASIQAFANVFEQVCVDR